MKIVVNDNGSDYWEYINVPDDIYKQFQQISKFTINAYFTAWAKRDWGINLSIVTKENMDKLKEIIFRTSRRSYPELFLFPELRINIGFWLSYWVTCHMKLEIETYLYNQ